MSDAGQPWQLQLGAKDLQQEITVLPAIAGDLIDPQCRNVIEEARSRLRSAVGKPEQTFTWEVSAERPIVTAVSEGSYESKPGGKGPPIIGSLSFRWELRTGPAPVQSVALLGNITTQIQLRDPSADEGSYLSMWRMEVGDHASPGCCFHAQVLGDSEKPPFPRFLPVPRLPTFPPTPMTCMEFLLGELFQRTWSERVERNNGNTQVWNRLQRDRFERYLSWQQRAVSNASGSPLMQLKRFPPADALYST